VRSLLPLLLLNFAFQKKITFSKILKILIRRGQGDQYYYYYTVDFQTKIPGPLFTRILKILIRGGWGWQGVACFSLLLLFNSSFYLFPFHISRGRGRGHSLNIIFGNPQIPGGRGIRSHFLVTIHCPFSYSINSRRVRTPPPHPPPLHPRLP
jgi:hypothetical protein